VNAGDNPGAGPGRQGNRLGLSFLLASVALALFGLIRFSFNIVGLRVFGAEYLGQINLALSSYTVAAVLLATVPSVFTSKFVSECLGRDEVRRARTLFGAMLVLTLSATVVSITVADLAGVPFGERLLLPYVPAFGLYLLFKSSYFAFGMATRYFRSELIAAAAFFGLFGVACALSLPWLATASLLAHPLVFSCLALVDHRRCIEFHGSLAELRRSWKQYASYSGFTFVNALSGLATYHLVIIFAGLLLDSPSDVGYLGVLMATLSPLNLLPTALGTVLFPELARRFGARDEAAQRHLVGGMVLLLQMFTVVAVAPLMAMPEWVLQVIDVPLRPDLSQAWCWLALSFALSVVSSPCGHYLNATRFVHVQAAIAACSIVAGVVTGMIALPLLGTLGAGLMRFAAAGGAAWVRMGVSERRLRWVEGSAIHLVTGQVALAAMFLAGMIGLDWRLAVLGWIAVSALQLPGLRTARDRLSGPAPLPDGRP